MAISASSIIAGQAFVQMHIDSTDADKALSDFEKKAAAQTKRTGETMTRVMGRASRQMASLLNNASDEAVAASKRISTAYEDAQRRLSMFTFTGGVMRSLHSEAAAGAQVIGKAYQKSYTIAEKAASDFFSQTAAISQRVGPGLPLTRGADAITKFQVRNYVEDLKRAKLEADELAAKLDFVRRQARRSSDEFSRRLGAYRQFRIADAFNTSPAIQRLQQLNTAAGNVLTNIRMKVLNLGNAFIAFAAIRVGVGFLRAAADFQKGAIVIQNSFGDTAGVATRFVDNLSTATGRSRSAVLQALGTFQRFFLGMEFGQQTAANFSQKLATLAIDFSAMTPGVDQLQAQQRFISALEGEKEALDRFGINLGQAAIQQELLKMGIAKTVREATEQEKVLARMNIILRTLTKQGIAGKAVETADELATVMDRMSGSLSNAATLIATTFAGQLQSAVEGFSNAVGTVVSAVRNNADGIRSLASTIGTLLRQVALITAGFIGFRASLFAMNLAATVAKFYQMGKAFLAMSAAARQATLAAWGFQSATAAMLPVVGAIVAIGLALWAENSAKAAFKAQSEFNGLTKQVSRLALETDRLVSMGSASGEDLNKQLDLRRRKLEAVNEAQQQLEKTETVAVRNRAGLSKTRVSKLTITDEAKYNELMVQRRSLIEQIEKLEEAATGHRRKAAELGLSPEGTTLEELNAEAKAREKLLSIRRQMLVVTGQISSVEARTADIVADKVRLATASALANAEKELDVRRRLFNLQTDYLLETKQITEEQAAFRRNLESLGPQGAAQVARAEEALRLAKLRNEEQAKAAKEAEKAAEKAARSVARYNGSLASRATTASLGSQQFAQFGNLQQRLVTVAEAQLAELEDLNDNLADTSTGVAFT